MQAFIPGTGPVPLAQPEIAPAIDDILDEALRLAADHHRTLGQHLGRPAYSPSLADLRQSPLGRDLRLLAAPAVSLAPAEVRAAAGRVREVLLHPMAAEGYEIPAWFWTSDLGRLIARAERAAAGADAWLGPEAAADALGVAEAEVLEWAASGLLAWLPDEAGRPVIARAAVERMRLLAERIGPERHETIATAA